MRVELPKRGRQVVEPPQGVCPLCHGRGWVVVSDGGAGTAKRCECQEMRKGDLLLTRAGIPERYHGCRLDNFQTVSGDPKVGKILQRAGRISQQYVDTFFDLDAGRFRENGLLYIGPPGTGKTHLAAAVLQEIIRRFGVRGRFVDFTALIHQIQATFEPTSAESKHQVLDPVIDAELLVLDELGAQKPTEFVMQTLYLVMNTRYPRRLPTLFTTNYRLDGGKKNGDAKDDGFGLLASRISPQLVSRLCEMAQPVEVAGIDYRREVKMHRHRIGS